MKSRVRSWSSAFINIQSTTRVIVVTNDDSLLIFEFENRTDGTGPFTFELIDARDKDNNTIPQTLQQAINMGPVTISGDTSINAFLGMMDRFGVGIPVYTNTPGGGTVCSSRIEGNNIVLTCSTE